MPEVLLFFTALITTRAASVLGYSRVDIRKSNAVDTVFPREW